MKKHYLLLLISLFPILILSQVGNLEIANKSGDYKVSKEVSLKNLDIKAKIVGPVSTTLVTMVFHNNSNRILEGQLSFPLPNGVSVSGYALDINGKLRNAVPVEKTKAKEVFESVERRRVDPGILEKTEANVFKTRIYPIPENGDRTIQITYHQELKFVNNKLQYQFLWDKDVVIPQFSLDVQVFDQINKPVLQEKPDGQLDFVKNDQVWNANIKKENFSIKNNLIVNFDQTNQEQLIAQPAQNNSYYFLLNLPVEENSKTKSLPKRIGLIWDNSFSSLSRDFKKEYQLLETYFKSNPNVELQLVLLNNKWQNKKTFKIINGNFQDLKDELSKVIYDGGTDYSQLKNINVDEYLFFTDGISSFGNLDFKLNKPVYTINSSVKHNYNQLRLISAKTGGLYLDISSNEASKEAQKLISSPLKFMGIKPNSDVEEVYPHVPVIIGSQLMISGIAKRKETTLTLQFGYDNLVTEEKTIQLNFEKQSSKDWDIAVMWAQKKINDLELLGGDFKNEIQNLSRQFGVVTDNTSLIVLEDINDYVKYKITPPEELRKDYDNIINDKNRTLQDSRKNIMANAEQKIEELKKWWNTDFKDIKYYPKAKVENGSRSDSTSFSRNIEEVLVTGVQGNQRSQRSAMAYEVANISTNQALAGRVAGVRITESNEIKATIKTIELKSSEKYMALFDNLKSADEIYTQYLKQREENKQTPTYYFDVANLLFAKGDKEKGLMVLSTIADLDIENEELYKLLLYKLKQENIADKSVFIAKKILDWRSMDPQSYRDYALALEDDGQYQEALTQLYKIFLNDYTEELAARDRGIEEVILMEINELINHRKANPNNINPKLISELPVNIRVALNWNKNNTDIDLWVTDPNGEKCMYSHKSTVIGGRISNDITEGFGPEQFILKKAIKGKYKIETNFFGDQQISISGPTTLMAEVFLNYASGKQERKIVVFQSTKKDNGGNNNGILIAEFDY